MCQGERLTHRSCCDSAGSPGLFAKSEQRQTDAPDSLPGCAGATRAAITQSVGRHALNLRTHQMGIEHRLKSATRTSCCVEIVFRASTCSCVIGVMDKTWSLDLRQDVHFRRHCKTIGSTKANK